MYKVPWHEAITQHGDYVVYSLTENNLYKYSKLGDKIWCVHMTGKVYGLCVDKEDQILVCLDDDVEVYDQKGNKMVSLSSSSDRQLDPYDVCTSGEILICDYSTKSILLFNKQYKFVKELIQCDWIPR